MDAPRSAPPPLAARRERQAADERALEAQAALARERQAAVEQAEQTRRAAAAELAATRQEAEEKLDDLGGNLRSQVGLGHDAWCGVPPLSNARVARNLPV